MAKSWYKNKITGQTTRFNDDALRRFPSVIHENKTVPASGWVKTSEPKAVSKDTKKIIEDVKNSDGNK